MIKAIIFDAYGTLIDTGTGSVDAASEILKKRGRGDISAKEFYADWKKYHREHIDGLTDFVTEEEIFRRDLHRLYAVYGIDGDADEDVSIMLCTLGGRRAFPEVFDVIRELSRHFLLAIGSTSDSLPLLCDIERNGIGIGFPYIFTSERLELYKPRREFYTEISEYIGVSCGEILFVGDSLIDDVFGPSQAGMKTCYLDRRGRGSESFSPDFTIKALDGIFGILREE